MKYEYPDISVVISTYERPGMLRRALLSVLAQDIRDTPFEVVVVDDASSANNVAALESLEKRFKLRQIPLLYYKLGENSGYQCRPKNVGVQHSVGEFIAYLDDDNCWRSNHLRVLWDSIRRLDVDMVYGMRNYIVEEGVKDSPGSGVGNSGPFDSALIKRGNYIDTSDILHSKGAYYQLAMIDGKGWDEDLTRFGDWNFVYRWALAGLSAAPVYQILTDYHWHGQNLQLTRKPLEGPIQLDKDAYDAATAGSLQSHAG